MTTGDATRAFLVVFWVFGPAACHVAAPLSPPLIVVDNLSPIAPIKPTPVKVAATPALAVPPTTDRALGRQQPAQGPTSSGQTSPDPRPITEHDPFRTDSLDGNRGGRELVQQILRMPGEEPVEGGASAGSPVK